MDGDTHRLSIHHVGGRGGSRGFPILPQFEADIINVLYDADADCLAQVDEENRTLGSQTVVLPYCLGAEQGRAEFNINYDPYTSSLLPVNSQYESFCYFSDTHDYVAGQSLKTMERRPVELTTLDELARAANTAPPPDFLSIDTQGSEFAILTGAAETLRDHTLALILEVEFHPLYLGQKLFGDLCTLLEERGFHFVKVQPHPDWSPARYPIGLRGEGFQLSGDALFLRRLDTPIGADESIHRELQLRKLAFLSIIFCQIEYALETLAQLREPIPCDKSMWEAFLAEFASAAGMMQQGPCPPTFAERFSFEASRARFQPAAGAETAPEKTSVFRRLKQTVRRFPGLHATEQFVREMGRAVRRAVRPPPDSPVERVLCAYGLDNQADALRSRRLTQLRQSRTTRRAA